MPNKQIEKSATLAFMKLYFWVTIAAARPRFGESGIKSQQTLH